MNTPTLLLYVETGFLPIKAIILARQWKFLKRYKDGLVPNSQKAILFNCIMGEGNNYVQHYINFADKCTCVGDIYEEYSEAIRNKIRDYALQERNKYQI